MTIAAGILATDGLLLFADSQFTGSEKTFRRKLFDVQCGKTGIWANFAISGDVGYAESIIQDCRESLVNCSTVRDVRNGIKEALRKGLKDYQESKLDASQKPEFVVSISTFDPPTVSLHYTHDRSMSPVEHYRFNGTGAYLAHYLMTNFHPLTPVSLRETIPIAMHILMGTKSIDPWIGGGSQLTALHINHPSNLAWSGVHQYVYNPKESEHIAAYHRLCGRFLLALGNPNIDAEIMAEELGTFKAVAQQIHADFTREGSHYRGVLDALCPRR